MKRRKCQTRVEDIMEYRDAADFASFPIFISLSKGQFICMYIYVCAISIFLAYTMALICIFVLETVSQRPLQMRMHVVERSTHCVLRMGACCKVNADRNRNESKDKRERNTNCENYGDFSSMVDDYHDESPEFLQCPTDICIILFYYIYVYKYIYVYIHTIISHAMYVYICT